MTEPMLKSPNIVLFPDGRMDTKNAATYIGLSEKTLAIKRSNGTGPKFVKRGRVFYFKTDIDDWMSGNGSHASTAQARLCAA